MPITYDEAEEAAGAELARRGWIVYPPGHAGIRAEKNVNGSTVEFSAGTNIDLLEMVLGYEDEIASRKGVTVR